MNIRQVLDKIDDGQLFVPAFQREYVWKRKNAKELFESLIKKYPTGTMLTWETRQPPELKGPLSYNDNMGAVKLILDGQQRITTLYLIMRGKIPPYYIDNDIKSYILDLHVNVNTLELEYFKPKYMLNDPLWIKLTDIFTNKVKAMDVRRNLKEQGLLSDELETRIDENFELIKSVESREFIEQQIPITASIKEAGYNQNNRKKYALAQEISNRCLLTQIENRSKSASFANNYLAKVKADFPDALKLQLIPEDESLWMLNRYEDFLKERRKLLANELNKFLSGIVKSEESEITLGIDDLLEIGENEYLEA